MALVLDGDNGIIGVLATNTDGDVIFDTDTLFVDAVENKVGIGTTAPNSNLHIKSTTDVKLTLETDEDSDCWINLSGATSEASIGYEPATNSLRFANAADGVTSNVRMTIDASGNVGIGTDSPDAILDVRGGAASRPTFIHASGYGGIQIAGTGAGSGGALIFSNNYNTSVSEEYSIHLDGATDDLVFISGDPADVATEERMRLTDDDATTLLIKAKKSTYSTAAQLDLVGTNSNSYGGSQIVTSRIDSKTDGGPYESKMRFWTNNGSNVLEERMTIDHDGNVGIGTTSPQRMLHIHDGSQTGLHITNTQSGAGANDGFSQYIRDDNQATELMVRENSYLGFGTNNQLKVKITNSGILEGLSDAEIKTSPIRKHSNTISTNTTIDSSENAIASGPISVATGVTLTINGNMTVV